MTIISPHDPSFSLSTSTLVDLLRLRANKDPDRSVFIFLKDGEEEEERITYRELDHWARIIAARLQRLNGKGERALLLYPPGLEYIATFFGCLYAGVIAVPAYPPRLNRPAPRIHAIVSDAEATIALTTPEILSSMEKRFEYEPELESLKWVDTRELPPSSGNEWRETNLSSEDLAFLQYTSGSTSTPKGVMLTHSNLLHNLEQIRYSFRVRKEGDVAVSWLPSYHDMGLIGSLLGTVFTGATAIILAPLDFLQRPFRWLRAISHYGATHSGGPNFAYDMCVDKVKPEQIETLDLSTWNVAFSGAEPVRLETMRRFAKTFEPCGFRWESFLPCYGLAEATLFVSGGNETAGPVTLTVSRNELEQDLVELISEDEKDAQTLVGCGTTKLDQEIVIVHPETFTRCAPDQIGEIWISGKNIAQGYWKRSEENERTFGAHLAENDGKTYLRTGDLGFLRDGELYITGRLKDLIIIRGSNHYPQDIELTVEQCHEALQLAGAGAFSLDIDDEERLVVVQEVNRKYRRTNLDPAIQAIRKAIAENHDLQVYAVVLIKPFTIPKTSSGKIQRHACKAQFLNGSLEVITEWRATR
ncbi:MAG: fatty acyl-AMP ligase [Chloroflexota bacterium]|nr:fatty acyl-AMP ligase [Chloroflexota bacterium]